MVESREKGRFCWDWTCLRGHGENSHSSNNVVLGNALRLYFVQGKIMKEAQKVRGLGHQHEAFILGQLTRADLNPSQVADLLFTDRATVTVMLQTMTKRGWIKKAKDPVNRKFVRISITRQGREKLEELRAYERTLPKREDPFAGFTQQDKADLHRLAQQLRTRMEDLPRPEPKGDIHEPDD